MAEIWGTCLRVRASADSNDPGQSGKHRSCLWLYTPAPSLWTTRGACLGARALADANDAVLVGVEHLAHLAHGLRVGGAGGEVPLEVQAPEQAAPAVVPLRRVGQAPWHQRLALPPAPCAGPSANKRWLSSKKSVKGFCPAGSKQDK